MWLDHENNSILSNWAAESIVIGPVQSLNDTIRRMRFKSRAKTRVSTNQQTSKAIELPRAKRTMISTVPASIRLMRSRYGPILLIIIHFDFFVVVNIEKTVSNWNRKKMKTLLYAANRGCSIGFGCVREAPWASSLLCWTDSDGIAADEMPQSAAWKAL